MIGFIANVSNKLKPFCGFLTSREDITMGGSLVNPVQKSQKCGPADEMQWVLTAKTFWTLRGAIA